MTTETTTNLEFVAHSFGYLLKSYPKATINGTDFAKLINNAYSVTNKKIDFIINFLNMNPEIMFTRDKEFINILIPKGTLIINPYGI
jgi:hypothetical protein